jgi:hypothetical protein
MYLLMQTTSKVNHSVISIENVGCEVLRAVVIKDSIFWDIT